VGRRGGRGAEALEDRRGGVALADVDRDDLERRPADLCLERLRRALGDDAPGVDDPHAVGEDVGLLEVLRGQEDGHAVVAGQARDLVPQVRAARRVEARGRLVEEQQPRRVHEGKREVEPALHAAGVAAHLAVGGVGETDAGDEVVAARLALALGHALQGGLQPHVLAGREQGVQRGVLEGDADRGADRRGARDDVVARDARGARRRRQQRREHEHGGGLAGAVRPEEAVDLARGDAKLDSVDRPRALLELADEALDLDAVVVGVHGRAP